MTRYVPIIPPTLDPRSEFQLAAAAKQRVVDASNGLITDISPGSPVSALVEGHAFAQAELLYYLNMSPEKWTSIFLSQVLGVQIIASRPSSVIIEFTRKQTNIGNPYIVSKGFRLQSEGGVIFETQSTVEFQRNDSIKYAIAQSVTEGSDTNVRSGSISPVVQSLSDEFSSITNPGAAYGGIDGESYSEAKERAFSLLRRRNPVSRADYEDLTEDILGIGTKVKVNSHASSPQLKIKEDLYVEPDSDGDKLIESLLKYKQSIGADPTLTDRDIDSLAGLFTQKSSQCEHVYIAVRSFQNTSIDVELLKRTRALIQSRSPLGTVIHVHNAMVQNIDVSVITPAESTVSVGFLEDLLFEYFSNLEYGSPIDFSSVSSLISRRIDVSDLFLTSGTVVTDEGLNSESVVDNPQLILNKTGVTILSPRIGQSENTIYSSSNVLPSYGPGVLWKLNEVNILSSEEFPATSQYGTLLECRSDGTSRRSDGTGGSYETPNDPACINAPDGF